MAVQIHEKVNIPREKKFKISDLPNSDRRACFCNDGRTSYIENRSLYCSLFLIKANRCKQTARTHLCDHFTKSQPPAACEFNLLQFYFVFNNF